MKTFIFDDCLYNFEEMKTEYCGKNLASGFLLAFNSNTLIHLGNELYLFNNTWGGRRLVVSEVQNAYKEFLIEKSLEKILKE